MTELEMVKQQVYDYLFLQIGYTHEAAKKVSQNIDRIIKYNHRNGKPEVVMTKDNHEMYL